VFAPGLKKLGFSFKEVTASGYHLLYDIALIDASGDEIRPSLFQSVHAWGTNSPAGAVDGDLKTRWGTGGHQRPGQTFSVALAKPTKISGIHYDLAGWSQDYPRGLRIDVQGPNGETINVLTPDEFAQVMPLGELGELQLPFPPVVAKSVVLTQTDTHPILDWSIAEVGLFSPAAAIQSKR
jgi:hypothetical protein